MPLWSSPPAPTFDEGLPFLRGVKLGAGVSSAYTALRSPLLQNLQLQPSVEI
jgi:hypothetical protein